ncbi:hypothetical protein TGMAS_278565 [Toxoplasma gondii MAS]|uniref:Uncharacterized protein n=2 Tax=Toxoplasma gondii TaxID=5811 RepID=A0A086QIJ9_TOXGO|nr:hypothetical protein TGMAS_278565 [Toxoplasma gondii MAS]PUA85114.1 hypothetical protein TGBR9_278565 [Toxoplasma gondii TgCATBr9]
MASVGTIGNQWGHISGKLEALSSQGQDSREQLQLLRTTNEKLDERVKELSTRKLLLQQLLSRLEADARRKAAESELQAEKTSGTRERLHKALSRKRELVFANTWMKAGLTCASLHHITNLRKGVDALMMAMASKDNYLCATLGGSLADRQRSTTVMKELKNGEMLMSSCLAALAKEKSMMPPARLTLEEKHALLKAIVSDSDLLSNDDRRLLLAFRRCVLLKVYALHGGMTAPHSDEKDMRRLIEQVTQHARAGFRNAVEADDLNSDTRPTQHSVSKACAEPYQRNAHADPQRLSSNASELTRYDIAVAESSDIHCGPRNTTRLENTSLL